MSDRWTVLHLDADDLRLTLLPGVGGRLWDVELCNQSILFQNADLYGLTVDETRLCGLPTRSPQFGFPLWGGEKTWIAPDTAWANGAPFPVLDSGSYTITSRTNTHVEMASAICPASHLSITRRVYLISNASWGIVHRVTNHGKQHRPTGIWSVMMLDTPAAIGLAQDEATFAPVFGSCDGKVITHAHGVTAVCNTQQEFKVGLPNTDGKTLIRCGKNGPWLTCCVPKPKSQDEFAHQHPVEVFNTGDYPYCEAEWHSPLQTLAPQETMQFQQVFKIYPDADAVLAHKHDKELVSCMS